jgi:protein disulfide-isomerase
LLVFAAEAQELVWETNVTKAMAIRMNQETVIFTGSDWCGWCIRLQKEVLKHQNLLLKRKMWF